IKLVASCKEYLSDTEFLLLSNGRVFADKTFTIEFKKSMPEVIRIGIPIYADNEELHDGITRAKGSFKQAIVGIKNLIKEDIDVEIRIVVMKQNYKYLQDIASFIANEIPEVKMVNIMALEMSGNAYLNREKVWIEFEEIKRYLYDACIKLISNGIVTNLYNFPLCMLNEKLYSISHRSITDYKIRYQEECEDCTAKDICGGFFNTTIKVENIKVKPIK
ncbi:MAG: His-Xaa-Ser system radical SAM maturase HxsC, partial [Clostridia bacterium]|nr:His-Xaa-Ser system radical SAM maturase HxsC [Clostridia bacterium]